MSSVLSCLSVTTNNLSLVFLILLIPLLFLFRSSKVGRSRGGKEPPLAAGAWPIIGHLWLFTGSQPPQKTLGAMADKYGAIFRIKIGSQRAVVINDWKTAKECFTTNDIALSSRPRLIAIERLTYDQAMFAFTPYGPYWREVRRIANQELLSNRQVELSSHVRVSEVEASIKALFKLWAEKKNSGSGGYIAVEMRKWFGELMLNTFLRVVAGKRCFGSEEEAQRCLKALRDFMRQLGLVLVGDAVPWLRWLDFGGHEKAMKETAKETDAIMGEWLEEHRRRRACGEDGSQDFMDVMLSILDGSELAGFDADTIIKSTTLILMGASIDTTAGTLIWILSCMLNNRATIEQAHKELDSHVGKERLVKETDISKLVYIQAIVKETLRLYPTAIFSGPREFADDCFVNGYYIPKGTQLVTNLWKIHTDPSIWSDPLEFKPERFLTTHKDVDVRGHLMNQLI
ncbi:cytochrome P450 82A1-like isoform X2 [Arachis ipaensis]|uniref:cytochrome P450 82A1-like isoform X2 n=1 Tax=Arachis ipaensis TaxID=130454 RepID=UPI0007AF396A|nr:cytochrome P450 82A1-like isoform X2 [Arachis ipaensis]